MPSVVEVVINVKINETCFLLKKKLKIKIKLRKKKNKKKTKKRASLFKKEKKRLVQLKPRLKDAKTKHVIATSGSRRNRVLLNKFFLL